MGMGARGSYESELGREARRYEDMLPSALPHQLDGHSRVTNVEWVEISCCLLQKRS